MIYLISIPDRMHPTSTKATEVTFPLEVIISAVSRAFLQLCVLQGLALASPKLLKISLKAARNFLKRCANVAPKKSNRQCCRSLPLFGLMQKYMKVTFPSIFLQFCGVTGVAKKLCLLSSKLTGRVYGWPNLYIRPNGISTHTTSCARSYS